MKTIIGQQVHEPDAWAPPQPVLEGPAFAPRPPLAVARDAARAHDADVRAREQARVQHARALHRYNEALRSAEQQHLAQTVSRLEDRRAADRPLLRDGVMGALAVVTPLALATSGAGLPEGSRRAVYGLTVLVGLLAGREWMEHQHQQRVERVDSAIERTAGRLVRHSIPAPPPSWDGW